LLIQQLLNAFSHTETDMTLFFRRLADVDFSSDVKALPPSMEQAWYDANPPIEARVALLGWLQRYQQRLAMEQRSAAARKESMSRVNPLYVPRNYLAQLAIDAATEGDVSRLEEWMEVLKRPYTEQAGKEQYAAKRPEWARERAGCSMLSCSS
jgi:uncharacterized protein YdiU (UPF0061 family)